MAKFASFSNLISGIGGIIVGAATILPFVSPPKIQTPPDLIEALDRIADQIASNNFQVEKGAETQITTALDDFSQRVAEEAFGIDGEVPSVPRSIAGIAQYPYNIPFDYVAPNGVKKLFVAMPITSPGVHFKVNGERTRTMRLGDSIEVIFGTLTCRFELIDFARNDFMRTRSTCR